MSFFYFYLSQKSGICYTVTEVKEIEMTKNVILYIANVRKHVGREISEWFHQAQKSATLEEAYYIYFNHIHFDTDYLLYCAV